MVKSEFERQPEDRGSVLPELVLRVGNGGKLILSTAFMVSLSKATDSGFIASLRCLLLNVLRWSAAGI